MRENTPWQKRDGAECKAYHAWYDAAYVFFNSVDGLKGSDDFETFTNAEKDGNCFVFEHIYYSISASYKVLMNQAKENIIRVILGDNYDTNSKKLVQKKDAKTAVVMASDGVDLVTTYNNLIECRNQLVHAGTFNMAFDEAVRSYQIGKKLIEVFDETMKR